MTDYNDMHETIDVAPLLLPAPAGFDYLTDMHYMRARLGLAAVYFYLIKS